MATVAVAAVDADLECVTSQQRWKPVASRQTHAAHRDALVEQLHARFLAQAAPMCDRALAGAQRVHPCPDSGGNEKQGDQGSGHDGSVAATRTRGKTDTARAATIDGVAARHRVA